MQPASVVSMASFTRDSAACAELALASAGAAADHIAAAELLLSHAQWPQAQALAVFAYEETGKACLRLTETVSPPELAPFWKQHDADKEQHVRKLTAVQSINMIIALLLGERQADSDAMALLAEFDGLARRYHQRKNQSLYVDWRNGEISRPSDVDEQEATSTVSTVRSAVDFIVPLVRATIGLSRQGLIEAPTADFLERAVQAQAEGDASMAEFADHELAALSRTSEAFRSIPTEVVQLALRDLANSRPQQKRAVMTSPKRPARLTSPGRLSVVTNRADGPENSHDEGSERS